MRASDVAVKGDRQIACGINGYFIRVRNVLVMVHNQVRICVSPYDRTILLREWIEREDGNKWINDAIGRNGCKIGNEMGSNEALRASVWEADTIKIDNIVL